MTWRQPNACNALWAGLVCATANEAAKLKMVGNPVGSFPRAREGCGNYEFSEADCTRPDVFGDCRSSEIGTFSNAVNSKSNEGCMCSTAPCAHALRQDILEIAPWTFRRACQDNTQMGAMFDAANENYTVALLSAVHGESGCDRTWQGGKGAKTRNCNET